ncbi:MAG: class I SAM-dependent methyltransferase [Candidatus Binataceae bacterium]
MSYSLRLRLLDLKALLRMRRDVFRDIYRYNLWGGGESRSGQGSTLQSTVSVRAQLPGIIRRFGIRTMLDAPCGDFHWMSRVPLGLDLYIGGDIVPEVIESNRRLYDTDSGRRRFRVLDITRNPIPKVDLIFCRHCMIHVPLAEAQRCLNNFRRSGSTYLMATTVPDCKLNRDIRSGGFRPLNLQLAPFLLPEPLAQIHDAVIIEGRSQGDGWLYMWKLNDPRD